MLCGLAVRFQTTPWIHDRSRVRMGVRPRFPLHLPLQQWQPSTACSATGPPSARQGPPCSPPPPPLWRYRMRPLPQPWDRCVAAGLSSKALLRSGTTSTVHAFMVFVSHFPRWCRRTVTSPAARALLWTHFFLELGQAAAPCLRPCGSPTARGGQQVRVSSGGRVFLIPCTIHRVFVCVVALLVAGAEAAAALPPGSTHLGLGASGIVIVHNEGYVSCACMCVGACVAAPDGFT